MAENNRYLTCKAVKFYSQTDESAFFWLIKKIKCIEKFEGAGDELYLDLVDKELDYNDIKELIGLTYRYKIDMKQLAPLMNEKNRQAFKPWKTKIFGKSTKKKVELE